MFFYRLRICNMTVNKKNKNQNDEINFEKFYSIPIYYFYIFFQIIFKQSIRIIIKFYKICFSLHAPEKEHNNV